MATYYKPSNKFSFSGFPHFLAGLLLLVPLLGVAYAYLLWYIPLIYINLIVCLGFGGVVGYLMSQIVQRGKVRNKFIALSFGLIAGVFALYCQWVVWIDLVLNAGQNYGNDHIGITVSNISTNQTWMLFQAPSAVWAFIKAVNEVGTWGIRGATVSGIFLAIIWAIEAIVIVGMAMVFPLAKAGKPFCETGNEWANEVELPATGYIQDPAGFKSDLENDKAGVLASLEKGENTASHSMLTVYECPASNQYYVSATNKVAGRDKDGKLEFKDTLIFDYLSVNPEEGKLLLAGVNSPQSVNLQPE
jgi:hypothetical protein